MAKSPFGLKEIRPQKPGPEWTSGRWLAATVGGVGRPLLVCTVYGHVNENGGRCNLQLRHELAEFTQEFRGGFWIIAGDWNESFEDMVSEPLWRTVGATLVAADEAKPTFLGPAGRGRCLDYFVVGPELSALVGKVSRHMDTHIYGHCPVSIFLRHSVELRAVSVLSRPRVPKGHQKHAEDPLCVAIEAEMREFALPWFSPVIRGERDVREEYRRETEAKWIRWNELAERWRWVSITGEEPPAAAKGHGRVPTLSREILRPHEAKLVFSDLDFCELALVTVTRRLEHVVGGLDRRGMNSWKQVQGHLLKLGEGHWRRFERCAKWRERIDALVHCQREQHEHALGLGRELLEDLRADLTRLNSERKQERITAWKKWCESALQGSMVTAYQWLRRKSTAQVIAIPDTSGELTQDPERVAEGALQAWAGLWRAHQTIPEAQGSFVQDSLDDAPLPALTVQDLRACLAQPAGQGKGVDSWTGAELSPSRT